MFQDTVVKATQRVNYFDDEKALAGWATLTIRNAAIDRHRQIKTRSNILEQIALQKLEEQRADHHTPGQDSDRLDALMLCFQRLPEESRQILHKRYTLGESGEEIARDLKLSKDAVYQRLSRLHRQLRSMIEDELVRLDASSSSPSQPAP